jgi:uncharacterized protein (TIGR02757 family)
LMDDSPHEFILHHQEKDLIRMLGFRHRTFKDEDLIYFIRFLQDQYIKHSSLEKAFLPANNQNGAEGSGWAENSLNQFYQHFFSLEDPPARTRKHMACPARHSACKRLNMFLRWMVRRDSHGVDFGIWKNILPQNLICPVDVHVARVARRFDLLTRKQIDWKAALELTGQLRTLDELDPVKYDYALFGLGVLEHY